jgi:Ca-activated chloride channel homolog
MLVLEKLSFDFPWTALLAPLPLLIFLLWPRARQQQAALHVPFYQDIAETEATVPRRVHKRGRLALLVLWWLLLIAAACGPHWIGDDIELPVSGRDLMLAVDLSPSMQTGDMQINDDLVQRIVAVNAVVDEFIKKRKGDRLGLIVFAGNAYVQSPLTFDLDTVGRFLHESKIGFAGDGTAIGDAIGLAVKRLRERPGERHVLVLLTDGANNAGNVSPADAAKLAAENRIVIYTIGIGAEEITVKNIFGSRRIRPEQEIDEEALRNIANVTGGRYFRARNPEELAEIYALLDQLEPISDKSQTYRPQHSLFYWPLGAAFLLSIGAALRGLAWRSLFSVQASKP